MTPSVELAELLQRLDRGDPLLLLDVRNQDEFESWKLEPRRPVETIRASPFPSGSQICGLSMSNCRTGSGKIGFVA